MNPSTCFFSSTAPTVSSFDANLTGLGQPVPYKGPRRLILRDTEAEFAAKPPLPAPAATVELPLNANRILLAFLKSGDKPLKVIAYDIASSGSRAGDYRFFNFSSKSLSTILGEQRFAIEPGKDKIVSDQSWRGDVLDLSIKVASIENNKPKRLYSSIWGHRPGRRNFIFMLRQPTFPPGPSASAASSIFRLPWRKQRPLDSRTGQPQRKTPPFSNKPIS